MIQLRSVSKTVQSGDHPLTILHPLDYTIAKGQFVAIVGPSGSGKSTLLGLLAGLDAPSTGEIVIDGTDITRLSEDALARLRGEKIGFVFQQNPPGFGSIDSGLLRCGGRDEGHHQYD